MIVKVFIFCWELLEACSHTFRLLALYGHVHSKHLPALSTVLVYSAATKHGLQAAIYYKCAW